MKNNGMEESGGSFEEVMPQHRPGRSERGCGEAVQVRACRQGEIEANGDILRERLTPF